MNSAIPKKRKKKFKSGTKNTQSSDTLISSNPSDEVTNNNVLPVSTKATSTYQRALNTKCGGTSFSNLNNNEYTSAPNTDQPCCGYMNKQNPYVRNNLTNTSVRNDCQPTCCEVPLYDVSSRVHNLKTDPACFDNVQYSPCPCTCMPPPMPPPQTNDDLWNLQFSRWWGWNWVKKREEMANQENTSKNYHRNDFKREKFQQTNKAEHDFNRESFQQYKEADHRQKHFFSWFTNLFRVRRKKHRSKTDYRRELRQQYDTPDSSTYLDNRFPRRRNEWERRPLNFEGEMECYCSSARESSISTLYIKNTTRSQRYKRNLCKCQSWVCEKSEGSSSEECCPCMKVCPKKHESSADESMKYLALRMANIKGCDNELECCPCFILKENCEKRYKRNCCTCGKLRRQNCDDNYDAPNWSKICHKNSKSAWRKFKIQRMCKNLFQWRLAASHKKKKDYYKHKNKDYYRQKNKDYCKQKRKYSTDYCRCQKNNKYVVVRACLCQPKKKCRKLEKSQKNNCCCHCNNKTCNNSNETTTKQIPQYQNLTLNADQNVCSLCNGPKSMTDNNNNVHRTQFNKSNKFLHNVSNALDNDLYVSPASGKQYALNPIVLPQTNTKVYSSLPKTIPIDNYIINNEHIQGSVAEYEHQILLTAVCDAIMSARANRQNLVKHRYSNAIDINYKLPFEHHCLSSDQESNFPDISDHLGQTKCTPIEINNISNNNTSMSNFEHCEPLHYNDCISKTGHGLLPKGHNSTTTVNSSNANKTDKNICTELAKGLDKNECKNGPLSLIPFNSQLDWLNSTKPNLFPNDLLTNEQASAKLSNGCGCDKLDLQQTKKHRIYNLLFSRQDYCYKPATQDVKDPPNYQSLGLQNSPIYVNESRSVVTNDKLEKDLRCNSLNFPNRGQQTDSFNSIAERNTFDRSRTSDLAMSSQFINVGITDRNGSDINQVNTERQFGCTSILNDTKLVDKNKILMYLQHQPCSDHMNVESASVTSTIFGKRNDFPVRKENVQTYNANSHLKVTNAKWTNTSLLPTIEENQDVYPETTPTGKNFISALTSPFKLQYNNSRISDRAEMIDNDLQKKVARCESSFSTFCENELLAGTSRGRACPDESKGAISKECAK